MVLLSHHVVHFVRLYPCTMYGVCQCSLQLSYTNMHIPCCLQGLHSIALPHFVRVSLSISELHEHVYSHCSLLWCKKVLFTNTLSEYWCHIIKPYMFTKFHTSKHLVKRVTQISMFTLFFVVVRKRYCLPTSYQNIGVISLIPTCLQSFILPSI